jgi:hypothetical protein
LIVNAYSTLRTADPPTFASKLNGFRDRADPELESHLEGFLGYVSAQARGSMTPALWYLLGHIQATQINYSFELDDVDVVSTKLTEWCEQTNSIYFLPDGTVRDPQGRVLAAQGGEPDPEAKIPRPTLALNRRAASQAALAGRDLHPYPDLPPVISEGEVELRSPQDVAARLQALFVVASRADALARNQEAPVAMLRQSFPSGFDTLSPEEVAFMQGGTRLFGLLGGRPKAQAIIQMTWRRECVAVLLWALGKRTALVFPDTIANVEDDAALVSSLGAAGLMASASLRPVSDILDALDLHYRLRWIARQSGQKGVAVTGFIPDVVQERHHVLNWLVRYGEADWDVVPTPT